MYFYFTDHWKWISRWINSSIPLFIHSIRNMHALFVQFGVQNVPNDPDPPPIVFDTYIPLFKRFVLNLNFIKAKRAAQANIYCNPQPPHLHCRKPTVGRTSFTSKCDWPWVSDNAAPLNFKKRKNVAKQSNNIRIEKEKKRETVIYNSPRAYRSLLNSSYIRYKLR